MTVWHWLLHFMGADTNQSAWNWFWSGFGSGPIAWCILPAVYWRHHNCHTKRCWRIGHPVNGEVWCKKHLVRKGSA